MYDSDESADWIEELPSLRVNPDDVCQLIQLARDFHARDAVAIEDEPRDPTEDLILDTVENSADNPVVAEFRGIIADLDYTQQVQLVGLLWVGRGDYDLSEWRHAISESEEQWSEHTADYLLAHPMLAEHLDEGLEILGYRCE
jgi:hypothetical protein